MENFTIELDKYTYEYNDGKQAIFRNGELWREETGDNFILAMAMRIKELDKQVDDLEEEVCQLEEEKWGDDL